MGRSRVGRGRTVAAVLLGVGLAVGLAAPAGAEPTAPTGGTGCPTVGLLNGGFEEPAISGHLQFVADYVVPGWHKGTPDWDFEVWTGATGKDPYEGAQFIEINVSGPDSLFQAVEFPVAGEVQLSFAHRGRDGTHAMRARLEQGGSEVATVHATSGITGPDHNGWTLYQETIAVEAGPAVLTLESMTGWSMGNLLDAVSLRYASCLTAVRTVTVGGSPAAGARTGQDLQHTVVVTNVGEGPAEATVLVDGPPPGTTLVPGTLAVDGAPIGTFAVMAPASPSAALVLDLGTLGPGDAATVTFTARVTSRPPGDAFVGEASATFDDPAFGAGSSRSNVVSIAFERTDANGDGLFDDEQWGDGLEPRDSDGDGVPDHLQAARAPASGSLGLPDHLQEADAPAPAPLPDLAGPPGQLPRTGASPGVLTLAGLALAGAGVLLTRVPAHPGHTTRRTGRGGPAAETPA